MSGENPLVTNLRNKASELRNGKRGDVEIMSEILADLADLAIDHINNAETRKGFPKCNWTIIIGLTPGWVACLGFVLKLFELI